MTKTEAVIKAIEAGYDKPKIGVPYIKKQFNLDVTAQMFSITKHKTQTRPPVSPSEMAFQVKRLIEQYGAEETIKMVKLLSGH